MFLSLFSGVKVKEKSTKDLEESDALEMTDEIEIEEEDDYLLYLAKILKRVHKTFYDVYDKVSSNIIKLYEFILWALYLYNFFIFYSLLN